MNIPDDLVALTAERRIIPFVGAGFSDALGLPSWEKMLRGLCERVEGSLDYNELAKATGNDYLQIAEYLYLKSDRRIGPLRRHIDRCLVSTVDVFESGPHTELINLGAAQIYTTNYDDLIESAYKKAGIPVDVVVLPKDIALANSKRTQIVKYHGDLDHEETLVLTESNYYRRLDFDAPMDLKFRSDLLGKSVLFMGYSFRDVNIRLIWFKLMDMMRDVPERDRRASYIVRLNSNPVLEELYEAVGIKTIVLSPDKPLDDPTERANFLGSFLLDLSLRANTAPVTPADTHGHSRVIASTTLIKHGVEYSNFQETQQYQDFGFVGFAAVGDPRVKRLLEAIVPAQLKESHAHSVAATIPLLDLSSVSELLPVAQASSPCQALTTAFVRILASQGNRPPRRERSLLIAEGDHWEKVWASKISDLFAERVLRQADNEFVSQASQVADEDAAYYADLLKRLANGSLTSNNKISMAAEETLHEASTLYPSISAYEPDPSGPPRVESILEEIHGRAESFDARDPRNFMTILAKHLATPLIERDSHPEGSRTRRQPRRPRREDSVAETGSGE